MFSGSCDGVENLFECGCVDERSEVVLGCGGGFELEQNAVGMFADDDAEPSFWCEPVLADTEFSGSGKACFLQADGIGEGEHGLKQFGLRISLLRFSTLQKCVQFAFEAFRFLQGSLSLVCPGLGFKKPRLIVAQVFE